MKLYHSVGFGKSPKEWSVMCERFGVWRLATGVLISSSLPLLRALNKKVTPFFLSLVSSSPSELLMALKESLSLIVHWIL